MITPQQVIGGNTLTKCRLGKNARTFSKNSNTQDSIRISRLKKRLRKLYNKENFKPEIKLIIENLLDELIGMEHAKDAKVCVNIILKLESEKDFRALERQYAKSSNF